MLHYDEAGILTPAEVDKWTGHRLYSVEQIPRLNKILYLRDSGLDVSEIALCPDDGRAITPCAARQKHIEIENAIQAERKNCVRLNLQKNEIQGGKGRTAL